MVDVRWGAALLVATLAGCDTAPTEAGATEGDHASETTGVPTPADPAPTTTSSSPASTGTSGVSDGGSSSGAASDASSTAADEPGGTDTAAETSSGSNASTSTGADGDTGEASSSSSSGGMQALDTDGGSDSSGGDTTGDEPTGPLLLPLLPESDEFDDAAASTSVWKFRHAVEGEAAQFSSFTFSDDEKDIARIVPTSGGWYGPEKGPFIFKKMSGDFMMEAYVEAHRLGDETQGPTQPYNSAGIMLREPETEPGADNWVLHHLGMHDTNTNGLGIERKYTIDSASELVLTPGEFRGRIRICRVGDTITLTRKLVDDESFVETGSYENTLPDEVHAGMSVTVWNSNTTTPNFNVVGDVVGVWDYVRFWAIDDLGTCLEDQPLLPPSDEASD
ncbi:MAG: hypothetical protein AAGA54_01385 [Myxococcota bacterium]